MVRSMSTAPVPRCDGLESFPWGFALGVTFTLVLGFVTLAVVLWVTVREHQGDEGQTPP